MNKNTKNSLEAIFKEDWLPLIFKKYPFATGIVLFGSRVSGKHHENSDIDIMLNMSEEHVEDQNDYLELNHFFQSLIVGRIEVDVKVNFSTQLEFYGKGYVDEVESLCGFYFEDVDLEHFITIKRDLTWEEMTKEDFLEW